MLINDGKNAVYNKIGIVSFGTKLSNESYTGNYTNRVSATLL